MMAAPARRLFLTAFLSACIVPQARAQWQLVTPTERVLGRTDAPVEVIEYHSLSCGNCARFHTEMLPRIKAAYIDTGKIRLVLRDFPLDQAALAAATLAHCGGPDRYFGLIELLYREKERWAHAPDPVAALAQLGAIGGISKERYEACRADKSFVDKIVEISLEGQTRHDVRGTPSFVIAGKTYSGVLTPQQFAGLVDPLIAAAAPSR